MNRHCLIKPMLMVIAVLSSIFVRSQHKSNIIFEQLLRTDTSYAGQKLVYPSGDSTETTVARVVIPPGVSTGWHKHDFPLYGYVLQGSLSVERKNAVPFLMTTGNAYAEVTGNWHNGTNKGNTDCVMIIVYTGIHNHPLSVKKEGF